jgi:hypothetical protein
LSECSHSQVGPQRLAAWIACASSSIARRIVGSCDWE